MSKFLIKGGRPLKGETYTPGNKNAILPVMAATILADGDSLIKNVPQINDVLVMGEILQDLGARIEGLGTDTLEINTQRVNRSELNPELVKKLRASILLLGPLLARFGKATLRHPGGCILGRRAVGTHFDALSCLGAEIKSQDEYYDAKLVNPRPAAIFLDEASVTATENALMLASTIPGTTIINDAACEPHVDDLANFLKKMGADIQGAGTNRIVIKGVKKLKGSEFSISPDYIDVGTFAIAAAVTGGSVTIKDIKEEDLQMILLYLKRINVKVEVEKNNLVVLPSQLRAPNVKIQTRPWPGFPTDLMSSYIVLATQAEGETLCHDWMYESRMFFVDNLISMGAKITFCDPHRVLVYGPTKLRAKQLSSPDIRAGMAMIVAALCAQGESTIDNIEIIERGYEDIEGRLKSLGAEIEKVD